MRDAYGVDHVGGTWIGLALRAGDGTLYPPLYDGELFGGTRYMPIPILLHGGLGELLGDYLVAGKVLVFVMTAALLVTVVATLRLARCPWPVAGLLAATLLVSGAGVTSSIWIRYDALPVILQLLAVMLVAHSTGRRGAAVAAMLAALALAAKLSAVWAPLAIVVWLLGKDRRRLPVFLATYLASAVALLALFEVVSDGRLTDNVLELGVSTSRGFESIAWELSRVRVIFGEGLGPLRLLVALAVVVAAIEIWRRRATLYHVCMIFALAVLAVVLADRGTSWNQLLDLQVLSVIVLGAAWATMRRRIRTVLALALVAVAALAYVDKLTTPVQAARAAVVGESSRLPRIAHELDPGQTLLSEDPYVPISLGQRPVVLDPYMLWSIAERRPEARDDLVRRLDAREFDAVVLFDRPEDRATSENVRYWYATISLGPRIVDAIARNYRAAVEVDGRWIYARRPRATTTSS